MASMHLLKPPPTAFDWLTLDQLESAPLKLAVAYWRSIRGHRLFPARNDVKPRDLAGLLPYLALVKVIDGGRDFEHRVVGDAQVRAFRVPVQNRRLSEIAHDAPGIIAASLPMYQKVAQSRAPLAWRGRMGYDAVDVAFKEVEGVMLPLGETDDVVDHVATFCTHKLDEARD